MDCPKMLLAKDNSTLPGLKISYIANAGFILETKSKKIVIDGIFNSIPGKWCESPDSSVINAMRTGASPFNDIDIIAITHYHKDHFDPVLVIKVMENNPKCLTICPNQVFDMLQSNCMNKKIVNRIIQVLPPAYCDSQIVIDEIPIRILRLEHSHMMTFSNELNRNINKHETVENLGYIFELDGKTIFHSGDANPHNVSEFEIFELENELIDIAFIDRLFLLNGPESSAIINEHIVPETIVVMHISPDQKEYFRNRFINNNRVKCFRDPMQSITYSTKRGKLC